MSINQNECPICSLSEKFVNIVSTGDVTSVQCPRCGNFRISDTAAQTFIPGSCPQLSAWIREFQSAKIEVPLFTSDSIQQIQSSLPTYKVAEKFVRLMRAIEILTKYPGDKVGIVAEHDFPLAWASGEKELVFLFSSLIDRGLLSVPQLAEHPTSSFYTEVVITTDGWVYLDENAKPQTLSNQVFVAMSFSADMKTAFNDAIAPALQAARFKPYRVDSEPHLDRIDLKIMAEIKNSRFVIADVTQQKAGVYFEAGFALGLGIPVFWCVRRDDLPNIHFDTRQYNHIVWDTELHLREQLEVFIAALIGVGNAPPNH